MSRMGMPDVPDGGDMMSPLEHIVLCETCRVLHTGIALQL